ncbi:MAG: DUF4097 family beta strand repeat-containing protein [Bacteroidota bacterium]
MHKLSFFSILFFLLANLTLNAQETQAAFTINAANKTVVFSEIGKLKIVGTDANEMRISGAGPRKRNSRAEGLKLISVSGLQDNTGWGLSVTEDGNTITVEQVGKKNNEYTIELPHSAVLQYTQSTTDGSHFRIESFSGEVDVTMMYHKVYLFDVAGPVAVNCVYGDIIAEYTARPPSGDLRLHATYADVDLTLPAATAANLSLSTSYGDMYTDFDLNVDRGTMNEGGKLNATINGGGKLVSLQSTYDDIFIRKK